MEKKSISNYVTDIELVSGISEKTGKEYNFLNIKFVGGYETALFTRSSDAMFIIKNVVVKE